jgi:hypothetical protein
LVAVRTSLWGAKAMVHFGIGPDDGVRYPC